MKMFIKSQPDHLPDAPTAISRWDLPWRDRLALEAALAHFDATGSPVFAVRTFVIATKLGVYPPQRIMQWVSQAFESWSNEQGELSMDKAMNLAPGRRKTAAALRHERDEELMWEMGLLIALGATKKEAAEMVESRLGQEDWNKSRHDLSDLTADTLYSMYVARKPSYWADEQYVDELKEDPLWQEWVRERLRRYNPLTIPSALKSMF